MSEKVTITLSREEALVLFEFLSRFSEQQQLDIRDQSNVCFGTFSPIWRGRCLSHWRMITTSSYREHVRAFATQRPHEKVDV